MKARLEKWRNMSNFQSESEINHAVLAIADLMEKFGFQKTDWMIGKNVSLYFEGVFDSPDQVSKDISVHLDKEKLPWSEKTKNRSIIPPSGSIYLEQYLSTQDKYKIGIDFWPDSTDDGTLDLIKQNPTYLRLNDKQINIETMDKYIRRRLSLCEYYLQKTPQEIMDYYYANLQRYQARIKIYEKIIKKARQLGLKGVESRAEKTIVIFDEIIKKAYPELLTTVDSQDPKIEILKGFTAFKIDEKIRGKVACPESNEENIRSNEKLIYVFSHFGPAETHYAYNARALLTEGGSITCHAAIVARELKLPCIVGIRHLINNIHHGDEVEIDFKNGVVKLIKNKE